MADPKTYISEGELRDLYSGLSKEQLINILVENFISRKENNEQIPWRKDVEVKPLGL